MSDTKNVTKGAAWIRRGLLGVAGTAMAVTSVVAAPSVASAAPKHDTAPTTISVTVEDNDTTAVAEEKIVLRKKIKIGVMSMLGGGWA